MAIIPRGDELNFYYEKVVSTFVQKYNFVFVVNSKPYKSRLLLSIVAVSLIPCL